MTFRVVDAYLGLDSPYSYLASTQLDELAAQARASFNWIPLATADLFPPGGNPLDGAGTSRQYSVEYRRADATAWAEYYGVPFRDPRDRLTFDARLLVRAALAAGPELRVPMMMRLFAAVFVDDRTRIEADDCVEWAQQVGLNVALFRKALNDPVLEAERLAVSERARARGVFGVPFFIAGQRTFFGNDRLPLLERHLRTVAGEADW